MGTDTIRYLVPDHKRELVQEYVTPEVKQAIDKKSQGEDEEDNESGPPSKKIKLKGRNKKRHLPPKTDRGDKLCHALVHGHCKFGESCKFDHDIERFMKSKPEDIGENCYVFETFGKCPYSFACRYGKKHTAPDFSNIINNELYEKTGKFPTVYNTLDKKVQDDLRRKKYDFAKANKVFRQIEKFVDESKSIIKSTENISSGSDESSAKSQGDTDAADCPAETVKIFDINFADKLYLAPLTTVGNLPFRRICKSLGADITCGEMALITNILQGKQSEWALLKRHKCEDLFGVQICGGWPDTLLRGAQLINETLDVDFVDLNCGCPIDLIYNKGEGCGLMRKTNKLCKVVMGMSQMLDVPFTVKMRTGIYADKSIAHELIPKLRDAGASLVTLHGRSREQRYTRLADWEYIDKCAKLGSPMPEQRHWDISSSERFDMLKNFVNYGLEHWGSDQQGVETVRRFLLEWLSFLHRYIPVGLLEQVPQKINERPPFYVGRNDLETLMKSSNCGDWIKIT
ncbi:hypothetical protein KUTeg_008139 [Tegillarca granosa]|uniref:tRNA-dihydrouridine(47) synthase [NAD(P)(+)] n=1 Tax=Tegillarca granosa TaxID=220873 RepID=A0ABQ9F897_TEGGR|nr:hypothetical protein KUTeg_008139 [Tegillarca granosa]